MGLREVFPEEVGAPRTTCGRRGTLSRRERGAEAPGGGRGGLALVLTGSACLAPGCVQSTLIVLKGSETDLEAAVSQFSKSPTWMSEREAKG